ncbi:MAG: arsenate reductase (glutaredoxin) [Nitratireductor sp.]
MAVTIWHNPRCTKSRQTLALLNDRGSETDVVEYLKHAPSVEDIKNVLELLAIEPRDLMRKNEAIYKELNLKDEKDNNALIEAMFLHPILIERPVVINDKKAAIGRPPENVLAIL